MPKLCPYRALCFFDFFSENNISLILTFTLKCTNTNLNWQTCQNTIMSDNNANSNSIKLLHSANGEPPFCSVMNTNSDFIVNTFTDVAIISIHTGHLTSAAYAIFTIKPLFLIHLTTKALH